MLALTTAITQPSLASIKSELTKLLPNVKSSHRCEALARGLGYRTYASLLASLQRPEPLVATASGSAFVAYLAEHNFAVKSPPFYRAVALPVLQSVLEAMPTLTMAGVGGGDIQRRSDGKWENWYDREKRTAEWRKDLESEENVEPFLLALAFLARVQKTKTIREGFGSYGIKHIAENYACSYPDGEVLGPQYVSNGVLIAAAVHAGFAIRTYKNERGHYDLSVCFNMSKKSLEDLDCEIRPDGARAQDRRRREDDRKAGTIRRYYGG